MITEVVYMCEINEDDIKLMYVGNSNFIPKINELISIESIEINGDFIVENISNLIKEDKINDNYTIIKHQVTIFLKKNKLPIPSILNEVINNGGVFNINRIDILFNNLKLKNKNMFDIDKIFSEIGKHNNIKKILFSPIFNINGVVGDIIKINSEKLKKYNGNFYIYSAQIVNDEILFEGYLE